jgi:hypothetical protein
MHNTCHHFIVSPSTLKLRQKMVSLLLSELLRCTWWHFDDAHHALDGMWPNLSGAGILAVARLQHWPFLMEADVPRGARLWVL